MTQADLFPAPAPAGPHQDRPPAAWRELTWSNGRRYRWRVHHGRACAREATQSEAPDPLRWELEHWNADSAEWLPTRFRNRRNAIWNHVRDEALSLARDADA